MGIKSYMDIGWKDDFIKWPKGKSETERLVSPKPKEKKKKIKMAGKVGKGDDRYSIEQPTMTMGIKLWMPLSNGPRGSETERFVSPKGKKKKRQEKKMRDKNACTHAPTGYTVKAEVRKKKSYQ